MNRLDLHRPGRTRAQFGGAARGIALAVGAALLLAGCGRGSGPTPATSAATAKPTATVPAKAAATSAPEPVASAPSAPAVAPANADLGAMSVSGLLDAARVAYAQHHLVAPAGASAMDYYEAVLARDPGNQVAKDSLREIFPFAVPDVEKSITQNDFAEATREIGVMATADPTNYTLTLLRSKLDAQQKLQARQQQEAQAKAQRATEQLAAAQASAAQQQAAAAQAERAAAAARLAEQQAQAEAAKVAAARAAATRAAAAAPPKPAGPTRGAELVSAAEANYPVAAARNQTSGFVVVKFTVGTDGGVGNLQVVDSSPRSVFDSAAEQAIRRSRFKPALKDGEPVAAVLQRRIDFKFNQ